MASIQRVRRVANPRRGKRRFAARMTRNARGQFKRATAKTRRAHRRRTTANPVRKRRYAVKMRRRTPSVSPRRHRRRVSSNPVLIELGAINPHKRRKTNVAQRRRKRVYRRRSNPRAAAPVRRRRRYTARRTHRRRRSSMMMMNPVHHRRRRYTRRRVANSRRRRVNRRYNRNPAVFGRHSGKDLLVMTGGVLVGVAATKYIPTILPSSITSLGGGSPWMGVLITAGGAFAAGWAARKFGGDPFGDAVLLGGLAQVGSQILTIIAPPSLTSALALSGMGDIIPGMFVVPQNPIGAGMPAPAPAMLPVGKTPPSGVGAFRGAFGARR